MGAVYKICVFCGSSDGSSDIYKNTATALGHFIADHNFQLVYGGAKIGLMGAVADAVLAGGGHAIGVIPEHLKIREVVHDGLSELHTTQTMQERQKKMADLGDAFVILPGGIGTLAEFFEILTFKQLGLHGKPILVLNIAGYWDSLLGMLSKLQDHDFGRGDLGQLFDVIDDITALKGIFPKK
jgi:hypothetical protein